MLEGKYEVWASWSDDAPEMDSDDPFNHKCRPTDSQAGPAGPLPF